MLSARKTSVWKQRFEISEAGRHLATWERATWRAGGAFQLDGARYEVKSNAWGTKYTMRDGTGQVLAEADRVGRRRWTITADGRTYHFKRASVWRGDQHLVLNDQPVGVVRRTSIWRGDAEADLPGLPLPIQVFALTVVLTMWDQQAAAAAASGSSG